MKNFALFIAIILGFVSAQGQIIQNGYYRVWNFKTARYVHIVDNRGSINMSTTDADLNAIELWKGLEKAISSPATVMNFKYISGSQYDILSQGTGISKIMDNMYLSIRKVNDASAPNTYLAYGTKSGATKYLADGEKKDRYEDGVMSTNVTNEADKQYRYWYITPIDDSTDQYFGIKPTVQNGNKYYHSFNADFPFSLKSQGMKLFYITTVDQGMAVKEEIPAGAIIPAMTPILVECAASEPTDNRLTLGGNPTCSLNGNMLRGVIFHNPSNGSHRNLVEYNSQTMRVLGNMQNGSLGFIKTTEAYLPANSSYLLLPQNGQQYPDEIKIVTREEYNAISAGIGEIIEDSSDKPVNVYNCQGILIKQNADKDFINTLSPGLYIVGGKKILVK